MVKAAIERLEQLVDQIPARIRSLDDKQFSHRPAPGKWSHQEILGHLIDSATNNHQRFVRVQFEESPAIWYDQDQWVEKNHYNALEKEHLVNLWTVYNRHLSLLMKKIPGETFGRTCRMKNGDLVTLEFLMVDYVDHHEHHLKQILNLPQNTPLL